LAETITTPKLPEIDHKPRPYDGPSKEQVLKDRQRFCNPAILTYFKDPVMIVEGYMQYLYDETGSRYLDCFAGIVTVSVGHCHPKVIEKTIDQTKTLQHTTTIYLHPNITEFAKKLAAKMPDGLDVTYFVNSGSDANDLAMMISRLYTGNHDIIAMRNSYHGANAATMSLTSHHTWKYNLPNSNGVHHAINPDPYRNPFEGTPEVLATKSANDIEEVIKYSTPGRIAAFIAEPIQGVGGATMPHESFLKKAYGVARKYGGVCIADEVQTGFGRTGDHYWGFENYDVVPDIVTMAKGIGNGIPLAAVTTRSEITQKLAERLHFNTFGGNPVSMAQGMAVMDVIEEEGLQQNAKVVGNHIIEGLKKLQKKFPVIGDVRGKGLMLGVEFVTDPSSKEPATTMTADIVEESKNMGVLFGKGGLYGNVIRLKPPMCITKEDADFMLHVLGEAINKVSK